MTKPIQVDYKFCFIVPVHVYIKVFISYMFGAGAFLGINIMYLGIFRYVSVVPIVLVNISK